MRRPARRKYTGHKWIDVYGDKVHDYTDKADVVETWVQAPQHAPEWIKTLADTGKIRKEERERLWNFAENHENGRDERPAMKIELALLRELTLEQNRQAVRDFVDEYFTSRGIIADVAIHSKMASDDKPNTHCHMLFFTREAMPGGKLNSDKNPYWTSKHRVVDWRKGWEQIANQALEDAGSDVRIDHRSHKARGLNKVPGIHLGPTAVAMEDKDVETARDDHNREVREENHNRVSVEQVPHADLNPWDMDHGKGEEPQGTAFPIQTRDNETSSNGQPAGWQQTASETPAARQMRQDEGFVRMMLNRAAQASLRFVQRVQEISRAGQFWTRPALAQPDHEPEMNRRFRDMTPRTAGERTGVMKDNTNMDELFGQGARHDAYAPTHAANEDDTSEETGYKAFRKEKEPSDSFAVWFAGRCHRGIPLYLHHQRIIHVTSVFLIRVQYPCAGPQRAESPSVYP